MCGKYPCAWVVLEPYLVFTCCWANARKKYLFWSFSLCLWVRQGDFYGEKTIIVLALVLPLQMKTKITICCVNWRCSVLCCKKYLTNKSPVFSENTRRCSFVLRNYINRSKHEFPEKFMLKIARNCKRLTFYLAYQYAGDFLSYSYLQTHYYKLLLLCPKSSGRVVAEVF